MQNKKNRLNIEKIIAESLAAQKEQRKEYSLFGKLFYLHELFMHPIDVQDAINSLESTVPRFIFDEIDEFLIGDFDFLHDRGFEAMYKDGAIYIANQIYSEKDLIENIIHEVSHSLEGPYGYLIYGDMRMHSEFLGKRERLRNLMASEGIEVSGYNFSETEYDEEFDNLLYKEVGYPNLHNIAMGLFVSPHAITSLQEYWAVGFEDYFIGDRQYLQKISPQLFIKIEGVLSYDDR